MSNTILSTKKNYENIAIIWPVTEVVIELGFKKSNGSRLATKTWDRIWTIWEPLNILWS